MGGDGAKNGEEQFLSWVRGAETTPRALSRRPLSPGEPALRPAEITRSGSAKIGCGPLVQSRLTTLAATMATSLHPSIGGARRSMVGSLSVAIDHGRQERSQKVPVYEGGEDQRVAGGVPGCPGSSSVRCGPDDQRQDSWAGSVGSSTQGARRYHFGSGVSNTAACALNEQRKKKQSGAQELVEKLVEKFKWEPTSKLIDEIKKKMKYSVYVREDILAHAVDLLEENGIEVLSAPYEAMISEVELNSFFRAKPLIHSGTKKAT
ncbi:hypothetical protein THAOC_12645 [Thalassiosira oceanica]|uniref:Uncharacterized protein n=1 Tax=Thalassiosira oceanica TaxID=159749 RepID=K0SZG2_THAOC|nr:hypothetical protein THAOC_12645 [Thalassiosira oceanica]|eukprot:EJK66441.1 hypothetical protein THAOC_12645 [Thalassiosira oceanica]